MADIQQSVDDQPGLLILCWIHGFKGNDVSFESYPDRIVHALTTSLSCTVHSEVYPAYRTAGKVEDAVKLFIEWLVAVVAEREQSYMLQVSPARAWADRKQASVILCAHSMGGLVAIDTVTAVMSDYKPANVPLWPRIIGVIAFDTPYLGVNPYTFKNTADSYLEQATQAHALVEKWTGLSVNNLWSKSSGTSTRQVAPVAAAAPTTSSSWFNSKVAGALGGTALAATAAGLAWTQRDAISSLGVNSWTFVTDHLEFVGALWKTDELQERLDIVLALDKGEANQPRVGFHCIYTQLPSTAKYTDRTFIILPTVDKSSPLHKQQKDVRSRFTPNINNQAANEVDAHVSMFNIKNDGQHDMALLTVKLISGWLERDRP